MEQNTGLTVALILVAIAVLMQAGAMLGIWLAIRKVPEQIESVRSDVKNRIDPLAQSVRANPCKLSPPTWRRSARSSESGLPALIEWPQTCSIGAKPRSSAWIEW